MTPVAGALAPATIETAASRLADWARARALGLILLAALALRVALLATPRSYFPDEIFQYWEAAHRLAFGPGVTPWEYRYGVRSWVLPLLLAGPMTLGGRLAPAGDAYLLLPKLGLVVASLGAVAAAAAIGRRLSPRHGLFAAFLVAIWSEFALFATQALTEAIAVTPILAGAALLEGPRQDRRRLLAGGALLALGAVLRFQYGPAIAALGVVACGRDWRRWGWTIAGGTAVIVVAGGVDIAMGGRPFGWVFENLHQNIGLQRSHLWTDGPAFYPVAILAMFGVAIVPVWLAARTVVGRYPALVACALVNLVAHTLIAHKEYRYILLSTAIAVVLAGIGTVEALDRAAARRDGGRARLWPAALGWLALSAVAVFASNGARAWERVTPELEAFAALRDAPGLCGVAIVGTPWTDTGGYTYLHRAVPLYAPDTNDTAPATWVPATAAGFDTILAPAALAATLPPVYARGACFGDGRACLFRRSGGCDPRAAARHEINRMLVRTDR